MCGQETFMKRAIHLVKALVFGTKARTGLKPLPGEESREPGGLQREVGTEVGGLQ